MLNINENEIVGLIDQWLSNALKKRASDIHFEPYQHCYRIRMRVDGVLQTIAKPDLSFSKQICARLKIMAKLNIAEQRLPQDGQLTIHHHAMRIATLPTLEGEKIVLRVMDNTNNQLSINELGFSADELIQYQHALNQPQGLILVTGPTGSGKTMTLYSGLKLLNDETKNICSVEDPVEMPFEGINQTQVNIKSGLTFAQALRAFLRQDPDIMMVGEIRDQETAEIAVQAAQTGHLVLSTLHTNSSIETLIRLNQMGIANYLLAASLKLIIAQRLIRRLCPDCKVIDEQPLLIEERYHQHYKASTGCPNCVGGYCGRIGIYEFLPISSTIQHYLTTQQGQLPQPKITLLQAGLRLVEQGVSSVS